MIGYVFWWDFLLASYSLCSICNICQICILPRKGQSDFIILLTVRVFPDLLAPTNDFIRCLSVWVLDDYVDITDLVYKKLCWFLGTNRFMQGVFSVLTYIKYRYQPCFWYFHKHNLLVFAGTKTILNKEYPLLLLIQRVKIDLFHIFLHVIFITQSISKKKGPK